MCTQYLLEYFQNSQYSVLTGVLFLSTHFIPVIYRSRVGERDSSSTGVTLKCVKDPFMRKGLNFNLAKMSFIIAKLFLTSMCV